LSPSDYFYVFRAWRKSNGNEAVFDAVEQNRAQQRAQAATATAQPAVAPNVAAQATPGASPAANGQPSTAAVAPETNAAHAAKNY